MTMSPETFGTPGPAEYTLRRTYWHSTTAQLSDRYDSWTEERREKVPEAKGELVSSLCESGFHAPALDIDHPAELESFPVPGDLHMLTVYRSVARRPYTRLLVAMAQTSLIGPSHARKLINEAERQVYPFIVGLETPARLLPSSTPGHHHLYMDTELPWNDYALLLKRLEEATIIQRGFYRASLERKQTMLRKPGVLKPAPSATRRA